MHDRPLLRSFYRHQNGSRIILRTITLELPPDLEAKLTAEAVQSATPVDEYALNLIEEGLMADPSQFKTGADVVAYWMKHGLIGIWADREDIGDSVEYARKLRKQAETRSDD